MNHESTGSMEQKRKHSPTIPRLYLISGGGSETDGGALFLEQLKHLPPAFPCMVQIREKQLGLEELLSLARKAAKVALPEGSLLLINKHADIARAAGLQGVHLPEDAYLSERSLALASDLITGCSAHSSASARMAEEAGADFLLLGPVFDTPSKRKYGSPQGLETFARICRSTTLPVFAVGGITPANAAECLESGAYGVAGISAFRDVACLRETVEQFYRVLPA